MPSIFHKKALWVLIVALVIAIATGVGSYFLGSNTNPLTNALYFLGTPVRSVVTSIANWSEDQYNRSFAYAQLESEVERLRQEVASLEEAAREGEDASQENELLRNLLGLTEKRTDLTFESATITAWGSSGWSSTFTISKGTNTGVAVGQSVIDDLGYLVGTITEVGTNWATVTTLIDAEFQMGGMLARTDTVAILEGSFTLMKEGKLSYTYFSNDIDLMAGDQVLTSSIDGLYPSGLVVGTLEAVYKNASGIDEYALVIPKTDLSSLTQVFVIKDFDIVE